MGVLMRNIFYHVAAFMIQKCKIMFKNIVQTKLNKYWINIWKEMQQIFGEKKDVHSGRVSPTQIFFSKKNYHLACAHVVVAIII